MVVGASDGFASPARTADVQFREIDSEFLKQQARIWLEAVLDERFDEEITLADVLVDGAILDRISAKILSLLSKYPEGEPVSPKSFIVDAPLNVKHSGKYLPYSNVDSFLKVCKRLGLTGVDLFSPPDVIEKKDIRKVCLCIRALSKKARTKLLDVPEFDSVSHTVAAMPTDFVGGIRESLSQSSSPSGSRNMDKEMPDKGPRGSSLYKASMTATNMQSNTMEGVSYEDGIVNSSKICSADENYLHCRSSDVNKTSTDRGKSDGKARKKGVWSSLMAIGVTLVGTFLLLRSREPPIYEVKQGDTLSKIAKRAGKSKWEDIVALNPGIQNPDLIYPSEKLRL